jgi:hypothetical protein
VQVVGRIFAQVILKYKTMNVQENIDFARIAEAIEYIRENFKNQRTRRRRPQNMLIKDYYMDCFVATLLANASST